MFKGIVIRLVINVLDVGNEYGARDSDFVLGAGRSDQRLRVWWRAGVGGQGPPACGPPARRPLGGGSMNGCDFIEHEGACSLRVGRINAVGELVGQALDRAMLLERGVRLDDLFADRGMPGELEFWWGVHRACGDEYRRLERQFWWRCPHFDVDLLAAKVLP